MIANEIKKGEMIRGMLNRGRLINPGIEQARKYGATMQLREN